MNFQFATPQQEPKLRALLTETPLHGPFKITEEREPDFFHALAIQGDAYQAVAMCNDQGSVVGMGTRSSRAVWLNKKPDRIGYLGALRIRPAFQKGLGLARAYQAMRRFHEEANDCRFYLSTIMEDNALAREHLTSGRAGLPRYLEAGRLACYALSPRRILRRCQTNPTLNVEPASRETLPELIAFFNAAGANMNFFPILALSDFGSSRLRDLTPEHFLLARDRGNGALLGTLGLWNQSGFKQFRMNGYTRLGSMLRPLARLFAGVALPTPGGLLTVWQIAFVCVQGHTPSVFTSLLAVAAALVPAGVMLSAGFPVNHPLHRTLAWLASPAPVVRSRIYLICWEDAHTECQEILTANRPFHLDPATL